MSQLTDSIQRQRWADIKGHSGREELEKREVRIDRLPPKRRVVEVLKVPLNLTKWLKGA